MENKIKRFLSLLLALVMVLGMMPVGHTHAAEVAELEGPATTTIASGKYIIKSGRFDVYLTDTVAVSTGNSSGAEGLAAVRTAAEATIWTITANEDGTYTISTEKGAVDVQQNDHTVLTEGAKVEIVKGPDKYNDGNNWEINQIGTDCGLNIFDSFSDGTSTGYAGSAWTSNDDPGNQWLLYQVPEVEVSLAVGESYEITGLTADPNLAENAYVKFEVDFTQEIVKGYQLATTIDTGVYIIYNTRANKWMANTNTAAENRLDYKTGSFDPNDAAALWTVTELDNGKYTIQDSTGKYLNIPGQDQAKLVEKEVADDDVQLELTKHSSTPYGAWQIKDGSQYLNDFQQNTVGAYGTNGDGGSQWWFYRVDIPVYTYTAGTTPVENIESGKQYVIYNTRANKTLTNEGYNGGLKLDGGINNLSASKVWTITESGTENTYYVQDAHGAYFQHANTSANTYLAPKTVLLLKNETNWGNKCWNIKNGSAFLNHHGGGGSIKAAGDNGNVNDTGSQWQLYEVTATPAGTYDLTVTATAAGEISVRIGNAIYKFDHKHDYEWKVTTKPGCTEPGVERYICSCGDYTDSKTVEPTGHQNTTVVGAKKPSLCETGNTGATVCDKCGETIKTDEVITQLPVANVLNGNTLVALSDCEYTFTKGEDGYFEVSATTANGTVVYLNHFSTSNNNVPNLTSPVGKIAVMEGTVENMFKLQAQRVAGASGDPRTLHFHAEAGTPYWNRCASDTSYKCQEYLFRKAGAGENAGTEIPGYVMITSLDQIKDGNYLIAAKNDANNWYVLNPANSNNKFDHVALVSSELHTAGHTWVDATCTVPETCSVCRKTQGEALGHSWDNDCDTECNREGCGETRDPEHTYTNNFDTTCNVCPATREAKASVTGDKITGVIGQASSNDSGDGSNISEAFDGIKNDNGNYWASVKNDSGIDGNEYLIANLNGKHLINKVVYTRRTAAATAVGNLIDYTIWISTDGTTWQQVATGATADAAETVITFDAVYATHVKLTATQSHHWQDGTGGKPDNRNKVMACAEFEIFKAVCAEHTAAVEGVMENPTAISYDTVYYCVDCGAEAERQTTYTKVVVQSMNVLLDSEIQMQYTVSLTPEMADARNFTIVLTKEGGYGTETEVFPADSSEIYWTGEKGYFVEVAIGIASGEMTCPVKIEVLVDGTAVDLYKKNGEALGTSASRSVVDYAKKALNNPENEDEKKELIKAMLVYGSYAQINFNFNTDNLAYSAADLGELLPSVDDVTADTVADFKNEQENPNMAVTAKSITAFVDSDIYLRVYLNVPEGGLNEDYRFELYVEHSDVDYSNFTYQCDEKGRYYVDITGIASALIDSQCIITVSYGEGEDAVSNTITTSMLSYVRSVLSNENNSDNKQNLVKAMYLYNQAANVFFGR